jgi:hypothetical protein
MAKPTYALREHDLSSRPRWLGAQQAFRPHVLTILEATFDPHVALAGFRVCLYDRKANDRSDHRRLSGARDHKSGKGDRNYRCKSQGAPKRAALRPDKSIELSSRLVLSCME